LRRWPRLVAVRQDRGQPSTMSQTFLFFEQQTRDAEHARDAALARRSEAKAAAKAQRSGSAKRSPRNFPAASLARPPIAPSTRPDTPSAASTGIQPAVAGPTATSAGRPLSIPRIGTPNPRNANPTLSRRSCRRRRTPTYEWPYHSALFISQAGQSPPDTSGLCGTSHCQPVTARLANLPSAMNSAHQRSSAVPSVPSVSSCKKPAGWGLAPSPGPCAKGLSPSGLPPSRCAGFIASRPFPTAGKE
jgi:hypothetical protein